MSSDCITFQNSGYFSNLIIDYLNQRESIQPLYNRFPSIENFEYQIEEKKRNFLFENRAILVEQLKEQYHNFENSISTKRNIELLKETNTFTITTGHQLNLFTGPLYFIYKICSVIKLSQQLKEKYPTYNFVPLYWMATEDHDFEEINHFQFKTKKLSWNRTSNGAVGRLETKDLNLVLDELSSLLNGSEEAKKIKELFRKAYLEQTNLADATRYLVNELFKKEGLVILDGDDKKLKQSFIPYFKRELLEQSGYKNINNTSQLLNEYNLQVNPREINLFYLKNNFRNRIVKDKNKYTILNSNLQFTENEILEELSNHPERFSPNVVIRPLYQETILPNLAYIGGGGELAYWLQLKSNFEQNKVTFPLLILRNSVLIYNSKQQAKKEKLKLSWQELFLKKNDLYNKKVKEISEFKIDFTEEKEILNKQFQKLKTIAEKTDFSFIGAVLAQEAKQLKGLAKLEKRLLKAEKKKHEDFLIELDKLYESLFPNSSLQERKNNFFEFALEYGSNNLIEKIIEEINPLENTFNLLSV